MNKSDLAQAVAQATGLSKDQANEAVTAVVNSMMAAIAKGETVRIPGFGTFGSRTRAKRKGIDPRTKKTIQIPERKVPTFKAGSILKEVVAKPSKASKLIASKPASAKSAKKAAAKPAAKSAKKAAAKPAAKKAAAKPAAKKAAAKPTAKKATASRKR